MPLLNIEFGLSVLAVALAFALPCVGDRWFSAIESRVNAFAARRRLAVATIFFLALSTRLAVLPIEPIPHPGVHDEFSHLLVGDTLAHGRLANPTPRLWEHFETFHENFVPAYASMYYPGQGIFLALGQVVFGHPFWGVWLSSGLMCAAFCWALQGWLPPAWAFFGAILAVIRLGTFSYWDNSSWGGSVAALGGALVIGALPRISESQRTRDALLMAFGFALLANTRPFESLFFCVPLGLGLLVYLWAKVRPHSAWIRTVVLPIAAVMAVTIILMCFYFYKTTGSPFTIPYTPNMHRYGYVLFPWQHPDLSISFNHEAMRKLYEQYAQVEQHWRTDPVVVNTFRALDMWMFFLGAALSIPLFFLIFPLNDLRFSQIRWPARTLVVSFALSVVGLFLPCLYLFPHYAAPTACAFYVLYVSATAQVASWRPFCRPDGKALVRAVPLVCMILAVIYVTWPPARPDPSSLVPSWCSKWEPLDRTAVERMLSDAGGPDLVIVRYDSGHSPASEWVFNAAEIEHSKIVWARDMGSKKNQELINYFNHRKIWLLEPDQSPPKLSLYAAAQ